MADNVPSGSAGAAPFDIISKKGGSILLRAGYQYCKKRTLQNGAMVWECTQRRKLKCSGVVKILDNNIIDEKSHKCTPDSIRNDLEIALHKCKQDITSPEFPAVPRTYNAMVSKMKDRGIDFISEIPSFKNIKSSLYRYRNTKAQVPKLQCDNVEEIQVPPKYNEFLLADYSSDGIRIIVFCNNEARKLLPEVNDYFSDGTFYCCTEPFDQIYTIHGDCQSTNTSTNIVPLVYALMSNRETKSYVILFRLIKAQIPDWCPKTYKTDFETAAMKAVKMVFPSVVVKGCYFHFKNSIWKKARQLGVKKKSPNAMHLREISLTAALPLLPEAEIMNGWTYITRKATEDQKLLKFRNYVQKQWLKSNFISDWCVFGQRHRTTNNLESWHKKLKQIIIKKKPNLMLLLETLKEDSDFNSIINMQRKQGSLKKRPLKHILKDQFIQECQNELVNGDINVGHFLEMVRN